MTVAVNIVLVENSTICKDLLFLTEYLSQMSPDICIISINNQPIYVLFHIIGDIKRLAPNKVYIAPCDF